MRDGRVFATLPVYTDQNGDEFVFAADFEALCARLGTPLPPPVRESDS
jgi:hypothetical protein